MNDLTKRLLLFLLGCIPVRLALVYASLKLDQDHLRWMGYLALLPAIGFMYIFVTGARRTGAEVFGAKIWWNSLRPIHSLLYFAFAYTAIRGNRKDAWKFLAADVTLGLLAFTTKHLIDRI